MNPRHWSCSILLTALWLTVLMGMPGEVATISIQRTAPTLLQFTSSGHVPGLAQDRVYAAGGNHALHVEFVNAPSLPSFIDPTLTWSTFLGGTSIDQGYGIAVDGSGNVYVAGVSQATWGSPIRGYSGGNGDAFAAKLDGGGNLMWNTFLGGSEQDVSHAIAVDGSGNVYVAGYSDATWGAPVRAYAGDDDAFAAKLDGSGNLIWNTFLGGSDAVNPNKGDTGHAIAVDGSGNVYVVGTSWDTWGSPIRVYTSDRRDAFAAKLDGSGNLAWNTFLGSGGDDYGYGIAVDGGGNSYVAGQGCGSWGSPVRGYAGWCDGFAAKLNGSGSLAWNTFLGGSGDADGADAVAVDGSGNVYVVGDSPHTWGSPVRAYAGGDDAFAARLDNSGNLTWHTFLGGSEDDYGYEIAADGSGNATVVGYSRATWGSPARPFTSEPDAFAAGLDSSGSLTWNTFLGGSGTDYGYAIAADDKGNVYVSGTSFSSWGLPIHSYTGAGDAFVVKLLVALPERLYLPLAVR